MAKKARRLDVRHTKDLTPQRHHCPVCREPMWLDYTNHRTLVTLDGLTRLNLAIRRCRNVACTAHLRPYRPEAEGRFALPHHEFGLDVIALIGTLRYAEHRTVPEIHRRLVERGVVISERTVTNLLDRYDELLAVALTDNRRLKKLLAGQGRVILAIDGLQPDVGHEVLWVLRDCLSGEILLARSLLSARQQDLAALLATVRDAVGVPIVGAVSDGQHSIRNALAEALPDVPHQLCQFHYLREAAKPIYEADRHAKKELKKKVRQVRGIERAVEGRTDPAAAVVRGYCSAVRSALTDDGRPPLEASGLKLHDRLEGIAASLDRIEEHGEVPSELKRLKGVIDRALAATAALWPAIERAFGWVHAAAHILGIEGISASAARQQLGGLLGAMTRHREGVGPLAGAVDHFVTVSRSYWPGLFACYEVADLPRTNNGLEQLFGSYRYHERRVSGRKAASPALVLRGSARIVAAIATRQKADRHADLAGADREAWRVKRADLAERRQRRIERHQFRQDPDAYLRHLEEKFNQSALPP